jgi:hypothetical protein
MREDVKDLLHRAADWYQPPAIEPDELARRLDRERRRGRFVAAAVAIAVFAAAGSLTWTAFHPSNGVGPGGGERPTDVTASSNGVTVRYLSSWTLVDLWPLARSIASWPEPVGSAIDVPEGTPERGGLPLLQLSNQDLGLGSVCGVGLTGTEAVLYVALNGGPYRVNADGSPIWSHELSRDDGPCGRGWYAYKESSEPGPDGTILSTPYLVFVGFGSEVTQIDRDAMFDAFSSLTLAPFDHLRPPAEASPSYVVPGFVAPEGVGPTIIASGEILGKPWQLVVSSGPEALCADIEFATGSVGGCGLRPPRVISLNVGGLRISADSFVTFLHGEVSPEVAAVRVDLADGRMLDVPIYTPPSELGLTFNFFVLSLQGEEIEGRVVALGSGGETLASGTLAGATPTAISPSCAGRSTIAAEVDGGGARDLVYHEWVHDRAVLGVCLGNGKAATIEGAGQAELLGVVDVNADGRDEILYGATSLSASLLEMAVWIDGPLHRVTLPDGDALVLTDGVEFGEERRTASAFGCVAQDGANGGDVASVTVEETKDGLRWMRVVYALNAASVTEVGSESGTAPGPSDVATMQDLARSLTSPCPVNWN